MKKLLFILFLLPLLTFGQSESHNFLHYDTTYTNGCGQWKLIISRPVNSDTAARPAFIFMPGQGEQGTADTNIITRYGPFYWMKHGWDGGIQLGNGRHYPIIISISFVNSVLPYPPCYYDILNYVYTHYRIKPGSMHCTGYSQGAFSNGAMIRFEQTAGAETGMKIIKSLAMFQGLPDPLPNPYSTWDRGTTAYKVWAKKYGGRYFYLEGNGSDNFRDGFIYSKPMNDTVPNSAYFSYENLGGGAHCCWNEMYDPNQKNWRSVAPLGPNNAPSQVGTNTMGNYFTPSSVFDWMLRQGDTSLVGAIVCNPIVNAGNSLITTIPANSVSTTGTASSPCGNAISSTIWSQVSGPNTATIGGSTTLNPSFNNLIVGTYQFRLTATDNSSLSGSNDVTVTVNSSSRACRLFIWDSTNSNINITNATLGASPALHGCDEVRILNRKTGGGYRSYSMSDIGDVADSQDILINFVGGAKIAPDNSNKFANQMNNCNHTRVYGMNMSNNADPLMFRYATTLHSHFITWDSIILIKMPGMFPSGSPSVNLTPYDGTANDTIHMFYKWKWRKPFIDSTNTTRGLTALWLGRLSRDHIWLFPSIDSGYFADYESGAPNPSCYINALNAFGLKITHTQFANIGMDQPHPVGHAAQIYLKACYSDIAYNYFGPNNHANDVRNQGSGELLALRWLFLREDPTYDGISRFHHNISVRKRKYPVYESQTYPADVNIPDYFPRRSPHIYNGTFFRPGAGAGNEYYTTSYYDFYGGSNDTLELKNIIEVGPLTDTTAWSYHTSQGTGGVVITQPPGPAGFIDTANLKIFQFFAQSGLADSVQFKPLSTSILYNTGTPVPDYINKDYYGNPIPISGRPPTGANTGVDIGAVQFVTGAPLPGINGIIIKRGFKRRYIRR